MYIQSYYWFSNLTFFLLFFLFGGTLFDIYSMSNTLMVWSSEPKIYHKFLLVTIKLLVKYTKSNKNPLWPLMLAFSNPSRVYLLGIILYSISVTFQIYND